MNFFISHVHTITTTIMAAIPTEPEPLSMLFEASAGERTNAHNKREKQRRRVIFLIRTAAFQKIKQSFTSQTKLADRRCSVFL